jgi:aspartate racemase
MAGTTNASTTAGTENVAPNAGYKKLGIIGGLGPMATVDLYRRIIEATDADCDQANLDITILNRPQTPDRTAYIVGESDQDYVPALRQAALDLEAMGCEVLCMPCMTGHHRFDESFGELTRAEMLSMPRETARWLADAGKHRVGIMATDGTRKSKVLENALVEAGLEAVYPDEEHQSMTMSIIYDDVKAGLPADMQAFDQVAAYLASQGCDSAVLGCTELSVINAPSEAHGMVIVDALDMLARAAVLACGAPLRAGF